MGPKPENFVNWTYGRLTGVGFAGYGKRKQLMWLWRCSCGTYKIIRASHVKDGTTRSCGCLQREEWQARVTTHGAARLGNTTPEFRACGSMKGRCDNPNDAHYHNYGGRGITVCEYLRTFEGFFASVGLRPTPQHSIDRINNDTGNYSCGECEQCIANSWPLNVRWATKREQGRNTRRTHFLTFNDLRMCITAWAEYLQVPRPRLANRVRKGWSTERVLTTP